MDETTTSSVIVIAQTTMQYGHNAPIRYRLWKISHCTNTAPIRIPAVNPTQYHWGRDTFATTSTPVTTTTVKPTMPSSGLGKPSTDACGVIITEPHETMGLMLQDGTYDGLSRILIFSTVSVIEANKPIAPAISTHHAPGTATRTSRVAAGVKSDCS